jgi:hypothetical protein
VRFQNPATFQHTGPGEVIPIRLEMNLVHVPERMHVTGLAPLVGNFILDTGAGGRSPIILASPFAQENGLPSRGAPAIRLDTAGEGVGGGTSADLVRIEAPGIGGVPVPRPLALVSRDTAGSPARRH